METDVDAGITNDARDSFARARTRQPWTRDAEQVELLRFGDAAAACTPHVDPVAVSLQLATKQNGSAGLHQPIAPSALKCYNIPAIQRLKRLRSPFAVQELNAAVPADRVTHACDG
jgi:hypothetical protein